MSCHHHLKQPIPFNPEISEFFKAAGFNVPQMEPLPNGLTFLKGKIAVQFWGDRIQVSYNNGVTWELKYSFTGFNRTDINHLMMLMHIMNVVPLGEVKKLADKEKAKNFDFCSRNNLQTSYY